MNDTMSRLYATAAGETAQTAAARVMLVALHDCLATAQLVYDSPEARLDHILGVAEEAIAAAEVAGIKTEE